MTDEELDMALAALPVEALDPTREAGVLAFARGEVARPEEADAGGRLGARLRGALVPALLTAAIVAQTTDTIGVAEAIYVAPSEGAKTPSP